MNEQEILEKLLPLISEVTGVREDQIRMESFLMDDLGAESLDLLDLSFLIEETFGVTITADEFERRATSRLPREIYEQNGYLTEAAIIELRKSLPEIPPEKLQPGLPKIAIPRVLNVAVFVHLIQGKLKQLKEAAA